MRNSNSLHVLRSSVLHPLHDDIHNTERHHRLIPDVVISGYTYVAVKPRPTIKPQTKNVLNMLAGQLSSAVLLREVVAIMSPVRISSATSAVLTGKRRAAALMRRAAGGWSGALSAATAARVMMPIHNTHNTQYIFKPFCPEFLGRGGWLPRTHKTDQKSADLVLT